MVRQILPSVPVAVDEFWAIPGVHLYFLSHLHEDHTAGLKPTWNNGRLYCSEVTRTLLFHKYEGFDPARVVALPVNDPTTISLVTPQDDARADDSTKATVLREFTEARDDQSTMTVTLLHANHCPGAVMFVFEGAFGTIVHTGDFRFHPSMIHETLLAHTHVDRLYLDNTYCDPKCVIPSRETAAEQAVAIARKHLATHDIILAIDTLGKEELLVHLAEQLCAKVAVPKRRFEALELLDLPPVFTTDYSTTRIHCYAKNIVTTILLDRLNKDGQPTIALIPSCLPFLLDDPGDLYKSPHVHTVPYSLHSSFNELSEFVKLLTPSEVVPIVPDRHADVNVHFRHYLNPTPPLWVRKSHRQVGARIVTITSRLTSKRSFNFSGPGPMKRPRPQFEDDDESENGERSQHRPKEALAPAPGAATHHLRSPSTVKAAAHASMLFSIIHSSEIDDVDVDDESAVPLETLVTTRPTATAATVQTQDGLPAPPVNWTQLIARAKRKLHRWQQMRRELPSGSS